MGSATWAGDAPSLGKWKKPVGSCRQLLFCVPRYLAAGVLRNSGELHISTRRSQNAQLLNELSNPFPIPPEVLDTEREGWWRAVVVELHKRWLEYKTVPAKDMTLPNGDPLPESIRPSARMGHKCDLLRQKLKLHQRRFNRQLSPQQRRTQTRLLR